MLGSNRWSRCLPDHTELSLNGAETLVDTGQFKLEGRHLGDHLLGALVEDVFAAPSVLKHIESSVEVMQGVDHLGRQRSVRSR
ncbi:MAG: hypothetical protein ACPGNP_03720 [Acidimicrobiales bacterium]